MIWRRGGDSNPRYPDEGVQRFSKPLPHRPNGKATISLGEHADTCCTPCCTRDDEMPPDLAVVVDAWADLPEVVRAGIVATVQAVSKSK